MPEAWCEPRGRPGSAHLRLGSPWADPPIRSRILAAERCRPSTRRGGAPAPEGCQLVIPPWSPTAVKASGSRYEIVPVTLRPGVTRRKLQHDGMTELPLDQVDARLAEDPTADVLCPLGEVHVRVRPVRADRHTRARIAEEDRGEGRREPCSAT